MSKAIGKNDNQIVIYNTDDGKSSVSLLAKEGNAWLDQQSMAELFDTSVPNISMHISNILKDKELEQNSVIKNYLTTASDGKNYEVIFYCYMQLQAKQPLKLSFLAQMKISRIWLSQAGKEKLFANRMFTLQKII